MSEFMRKIAGFFRLQKHLSNHINQITLKEIVRSQFVDKKYPDDKTLVMMVGLSKSGKTYIVENNTLLRDYYKISTNKIHDAINTEFPFLKDDNTTEGKSYWERQYLTRIIRNQVLTKALRMGIPVMSDSCNLSRKDRKKTLDQAKSFGYFTVIIWVNCPKLVLLERLTKADEDNIIRGSKPTWVDLHENQKLRFDKPSHYECDDLILAESPIDDPEKIY